jgi:hypothetical protein
MSERPLMCCGQHGAQEEKVDDWDGHSGNAEADHIRGSPGDVVFTYHVESPSHGSPNGG